MTKKIPLIFGSNIIGFHSKMIGIIWLRCDWGSSHRWSKKINHNHYLVYIDNNWEIVEIFRASQNNFNYLHQLIRCIPVYMTNEKQTFSDGHFNVRLYNGIWMFSIMEFIVPTTMAFINCFHPFSTHSKCYVAVRRMCPKFYRNFPFIPKFLDLWHFEFVHFVLFWPAYLPDFVWISIHYHNEFTVNI